MGGWRVCWRGWEWWRGWVGWRECWRGWEDGVGRMEGVVEGWEDGVGRLEGMVEGVGGWSR